MTDEELIARLRSMHWCVTTEANGVGVSDDKVALAAADRIEDLNAKLAKAVEALRFYAKEEWPQDYPGGVLYAAGDDMPKFKTHLDFGDIAWKVLAELEETE